MENKGFTAAFFELQGRSRLLVEGLVTLTEYSDERINMMCRGNAVRVRGKELKIALLGETKAMITGRIDGFEFV